MSSEDETGSSICCIDLHIVYEHDSSTLFLTLARWPLDYTPTSTSVLSYPLLLLCCAQLLWIPFLVFLHHHHHPLLFVPSHSFPFHSILMRYSREFAYSACSCLMLWENIFSCRRSRRFRCGRMRRVSWKESDEEGRVELWKIFLVLTFEEFDSFDLSFLCCLNINSSCVWVCWCCRAAA